jgi:uncharacterized protein (UPF0335 family)
MVSDATISVNAGPKVPLAAVEDALRAMKRKQKSKRTKSAVEKPIVQTDLEGPDYLGTIPENDAKIAGIAADRLRSLVERIERLDEERKALSADIRDVYAEAKSAGFDVKVLRQILRLRKQEPAEVEEQEALLDVYRRALGM